MLEQDINLSCCLISSIKHKWFFNMKGCCYSEHNVFTKLESDFWYILQWVSLKSVYSSLLNSISVSCMVVVFWLLVSSLHSAVVFIFLYQHVDRIEWTTVVVVVCFWRILLTVVLISALLVHSYSCFQCEQSVNVLSFLCLKESSHFLFVRMWVLLEQLPNVDDVLSVLLFVESNGSVY